MVPFWVWPPSVTVLDSLSYSDKIPQAGWPNHRHGLTHSSGAWGSMIKVLQIPFQVRALFWAHSQLPSHRVLTWPLVCVPTPVVSSPSYKDTSPVGTGLHPYDLI